jgi:hypothetical protein
MGVRLYGEGNRHPPHPKSSPGRRSCVRIGGQGFLARAYVVATTTHSSSSVTTLILASRRLGLARVIY